MHQNTHKLTLPPAAAQLVLGHSRFGCLFDGTLEFLGSEILKCRNEPQDFARLCKTSQDFARLRRTSQDCHADPRRQACSSSRPRPRELWQSPLPLNTSLPCVSTSLPFPWCVSWTLRLSEARGVCGSTGFGLRSCFSLPKTQANSKALSIGPLPLLPMLDGRNLPFFCVRLLRLLRLFLL